MRKKMRFVNDRDLAFSNVLISVKGPWLSKAVNLANGASVLNVKYFLNNFLNKMILFFLNILIVQTKDRT